MTIPVSTVPAARKWIFDQASAVLTPDPLNSTARLLVCMDEPGPDQPEDIVVIGEVSSDISVNSLVGGGGAGWLEERYRITVEIEVFRGGDDAQAVSERAYGLAAGVIGLVRTDPALGGAVLVARPVVATYTGTASDDHMGRLGSLSLQIECYQRI